MRNREKIRKLEERGYRIVLYKSEPSAYPPYRQTTIIRAKSGRETHYGSISQVFNKIFGYGKE